MGSLTSFVGGKDYLDVKQITDVGLWISGSESVYARVVPRLKTTEIECPDGYFWWLWANTTRAISLLKIIAFLFVVFLL